MGSLTLILGGARSGKSAFAERLARQHGGQVVFIATAQALDEEMQDRIAAHRQNRPAGWQTLEIPTDVGRQASAQINAQLPQANLVVLDCLTFLVSNLLLQSAPDLDNPEPGTAAAVVESEIEQLIEAVQTSAADWLVVSNEVGMGLVPPYPVGRLFRDWLGWSNQQLAARADRVYFLLAGIPLRLTPEV